MSSAEGRDRTIPPPTGRRGATIVGAPWTAVVLLALASSAPSSFASEEPSQVSEGARIRVDVADPWASEQGRIGKRLVTGGRRWTGTLVALDTSRLTLRVPEVERPREVPRSVIVGLDASVREPQRARGAIIGLFIGVTAGAILGLSAGDDPPGFFSFSAGEKALILGVPLGLVGLTVGALVPQEQWKSVDLTQEPADRPSPDPPAD